LKGRYQFIKFTAESAAKSKEHYEQALAIDPNYALAWSGLADLYQVMGNNGFMPTKPAYKLCKQAAIRALEIDEMLPDAHAMMGILCVGEFDWKRAEREFHRALELDPKSWDVQTTYSIYFLLPLGRLDEAIAASLKAMEQDPLSPLMHSNLGTIYHMARQSDRAIEQYQTALVLDPNHWLTHWRLGSAYIDLGKFEEAIKILEKFDHFQERSSYTNALGLLGYAYARASRIGDAKKLLSELEELATRSYVMPTAFARIYLGLGNIDRAFDYIDKAADGIDALIISLPVAPVFDPLRSHPRYKALLCKMNLES
jgi:tetratricopeptide (TPR) repeat protein